MDLQLADKIIAVTGGAKGIGRAVAEALAQEGAIPVIIDRDEAAGLALVDAIAAQGAKAGFVKAELTSPAECTAAAQKLAALYGRVDGLVNNAGVNDGVGLENGSYERFMESLHKNLVHYYLMAQCLLPELKRSQGALVNISSKTAETGQGNTSAYAAANGGRNALTREWAVELLKYGIRVNAVVVAECYTPLYEQWIQTLPDPAVRLAAIQSKIPLGRRFTTGKEIADMVVFLLSPLSGHTTGQLIHVDGGYVHLDRALNT